MVVSYILSLLWTASFAPLRAPFWFIPNSPLVKVHLVRQTTEVGKITLAPDSMDQLYLYPTRSQMQDKNKNKLLDSLQA